MASFSPAHFQTVSQQKVVKNGERFGRWPFHRISVFLWPHSHQHAVPIAWCQVELNDGGPGGYFVRAKAHDLGNELLVDYGHDVTAADAVGRFVERDVMAVGRTIVLVDVSKPHSREGRHDPLCQCNTVRFPAKRLVGVAAFAGCRG
jgi:hypothetical protein